MRGPHPSLAVAAALLRAPERTEAALSRSHRAPPTLMAPFLKLGVAPCSPPQPRQAKASASRCGVGTAPLPLGCWRDLGPTSALALHWPVSASMQGTCWDSDLGHDSWEAIWNWPSFLRKFSYCPLVDHTALAGHPGAQVWTPCPASGSRGGLDQPRCLSDPQSPHLDPLPKERGAEECRLGEEAGQAGSRVSSRDSDVSI